MSSGEASFWTTASIPMIEPEYLADVLATSSDIALVVSVDDKVLAVLVSEMSAQAGNLDHWVGRPITDFLTTDSIPKFNNVQARFREDGSLPSKVELNHKDNALWQFPVRYTVHRIGQEGALLFLGRDLQQVAETQQQLVQAQIALEKGYEERREYDARYRMLLSMVHDGIVFVGVSDGRIKDLNAAAANLLGGTREELTGTPFAQEFKDRRRNEFVENLLNLAISDVDTELPLQTRRSRRSVVATPKVFRAAGERLLIVRLDPEETAQHVDDQMHANLVALFRQGTEAIVFTDPKGTIETTNDAFIQMIDAPYQADVKGRNLGDFMVRGDVDINVLLDNAVRSGHMRMYSTKLTSDLGAMTSVEISVTYLNNRAKPSVGFLIRDASRAEALRIHPGKAADDASHQDVAELVGSATLKEIVAETSDVIEKMCIETAIHLTRNNRAAAAEMLGLSRQSFYVKLRKYDLLSKDGDN